MSGMRPNDHRQFCECRHAWGDHARGGWACLAQVNDPDRSSLYTCTCRQWLPLALTGPEFGPCSCQTCEDRCGRQAPRDEGSPDVCDDCLSGLHSWLFVA